MARDSTNIFIALGGGLGSLALVSLLLWLIGRWNRHVATVLYYVIGTVLLASLAVAIIHALARMVADCSNAPKSNILWLLAGSVLIPGAFPIVVVALLVWTAVQWLTGRCSECAE
jgi:hypothetical protein